MTSPTSTASDAEEQVVQPLPASRVDDAAAVMAAALAPSPAYVYILGGTAPWRESALRWILSRNVAVMRSKNPAAVRAFFDRDGAIIATYILSTPDEVLSDWDIVVSGMLLIPLYFGWAVFTRMREVMAWLVRAERDSFDARPASEVLVLTRLSVRPDMQGRGLGSMCVRRVLEEAASAGKVVRLATQDARSMRLYCRLGFEVVSQKPFDAGSHVFESWLMESKPPGS